MQLHLLAQTSLHPHLHSKSKILHPAKPKPGRQFLQSLSQALMHILLELLTSSSLFIYLLSIDGFLLNLSTAECNSPDL